MCILKYIYIYYSLKAPVTKAEIHVLICFGAKYYGFFGVYVTLPNPFSLKIVVQELKDIFEHATHWQSNLSMYVLPERVGDEQILGFSFGFLGFHEM